MTAPRTTGASAAGEKDKRTLWPWLLLAAIIAGLLIWWLVESLDDDDDLVDADAPAVVEETIDPVAPVAPVAPVDPVDPVDPAAVGVILVGDVDVLAPDADLSALVGETVEADTVEVAAVVADEAFYVGSEPGQTIMVRLPEFAGENAPESPFEIQEGEQVSFTGTLQEIDEELLSQLQLFEGTPTVETGDFYVQVDEISSV